ncbi:hypothetical protein ACEWY4_005999 [Coilia grayii]|uniref:CARD domain-containing protein n=1 Tax=Coilia grayii TaxID=363190 RepID=A0ABD1KCA4_9TELE
MFFPPHILSSFFSLFWKCRLTVGITAALLRSSLNMGNAPLESSMGDDLRCTGCRCVLSPCTSFSDYQKQYLHEMYVYVYNRGQYFREVGHDNAYKCHTCFFKPIKEKEQRQREEQRRRDEERKTEDEKKIEEERKRGGKKRECNKTVSSTDRVRQARGELIKRMGEACLKTLLDGLQTPMSDGREVLKPREREQVLQSHRVIHDQVTCLVDMVYNKGDRACERFISLLRREEYGLCEELGL